MPNEHTLTDRFSEWLRNQVEMGAPLWWLKVAGGRYQRAGVADYLIVIRGKSVAVELKNPNETGRLSRKQAVELAWFKRAGGLVIKCHDFRTATSAIANLLESNGLGD